MSEILETIRTLHERSASNQLFASSVTIWYSWLPSNVPLQDTKLLHLALIMSGKKKRKKTKAFCKRTLFKLKNFGY